MPERSVSCTLPVAIDDLWAVLADTERMIAIDPALESYEPELGTFEAGTLNRATFRFGPLRLRVTTCTEVLDPPHRVVFTSVVPSRPVRSTAEDSLVAVDGGTRYTVRLQTTSTGFGGRLAAPLVVRHLARTRRKLFGRLAAQLGVELA